MIPAVGLRCSRMGVARRSEVCVSGTAPMLSRTHVSHRTARQEKLLQGLMTEIIRMTSQMQPLEVGVPLYPFSHSSLFVRNANGTTQETGAPLPNARTFEEPQPQETRVASMSTPPMTQTVPGQASTSSTASAGVTGWNARLSPMGRVVIPTQSIAAHSSYPH